MHFPHHDNGLVEDHKAWVLTITIIYLAFVNTILSTSQNHDCDYLVITTRTLFDKCSFLVRGLEFGVLSVSLVV